MGWSTFDRFGSQKTGGFAPGGWEIIERQSISGGAATFALNNSLYESFIVRMHSVIQSASANTPQLRVSVDGGATYLATAIYDRAGFNVTRDTATVNPVNNAAQTGVSLTRDGASALIGESLNSTIEIINPSRSNGERLNLQSTTTHGRFQDGDIEQNHIGHTVNGLSAPVDAVEVSATVGTLTGSFTLLGLPRVVNTANGLVKPQGWTQIQTIDASAQPEIVFGGLDQFDAIEIFGTNVYPAVDNEGLRAQVGYQGVGGPWETANYVERIIAGQAGDTTLNNVASLGQTFIRFFGSQTSSGMVNSLLRSGMHRMYMSGIQNSNTVGRCVIKTDSSYPSSNGGGNMTFSQGVHQVPTQAGIINAIRFFVNSGNLSGKFTLMGLVQ